MREGCQIHFLRHCQYSVALVTKENNTQGAEMNILFTPLSQMCEFSRRSYMGEITLTTRSHAARKMSRYRLSIWPMHSLLENRVYCTGVRWVFDNHNKKTIVLSTQSPHLSEDYSTIDEMTFPFSFCFMTQARCILVFITNNKM